MGRIISFRGLIEDGGVDTIPLQTNNGLIGYKITKFELIPPAPGVSNSENVCKIFKTESAASPVDALVDFSNNRLLAAGYYAAESSSYSDNKTIIFDNEKFNQDIYVTNKDARGNSTAINYHIELEQMKLDLGEQTMATLKDIRNIGAQ
jgi:hypothetical protein